jgi:DNA-binding CsgD family transcriptional regulator
MHRRRDKRISESLPRTNRGNLVEAIKRNFTDCHTPDQFKKLLKQLREIIPYRHLVCGWGYLHSCTVVHIVDIDYPKNFLQWYLTSGVLRKDPVLQQWLRAQKPLKWLDVSRQKAEEIDVEYMNKVAEFQLQYTFVGGAVDNDIASYFSLSMQSEEDCQMYIETFADLIPFLSQALRRSYLHPFFTPRKKTILKLVSQGYSHKEIATRLGISLRTVKMHIEDIRKKLYAENLKNAITIALRIGVLD